MLARFCVVALVAALTITHVAADRSNYGKSFPTIIQKKEDGSFALRSAPHIVIDDANPYAETKTLDFIAQCIGYEPSPIGDSPDDEPYLDYYTTYYKFLWETDIAVMRSLGANCVRMWAWRSLEPQDHIPFLTALYENGMYAMLPFQMGVDGQNFNDLLAKDTRKRIRDTFEFFIKTLIPHPAVIAILIGNEPEMSGTYAPQMNEYMSLVNDLQVILKNESNAMYSKYPIVYEEICTPTEEVRGCGHLISVPFTASAFRSTVMTYYDSIHLDFWSIQPYFDSIALAEMFTFYNDFVKDKQDRSGNVGEPRRRTRLWLTERGLSAATLESGNVVLEEKKQADFFTETWKTILANSGGGLVVMSYVDEWWKGRQAKLQVSGCPDYDDKAQSACGFFSQEDPPVIQLEEWFGIFSQTAGENQWYPFFLAQDLALTSRPIAFAIRESWCGSLQGTNQEGACNLDITAVVRSWDTIDRYPLLVLCGGVLIVLAGAAFVTGVYACFRKCKRQEENIKTTTVKRWANATGVSKAEEVDAPTAVVATPEPGTDDEPRPTNIDDEISQSLPYRRARSQATMAAVDCRAVAMLVARLFPTEISKDLKQNLRDTIAHSAYSTVLAMGWTISDQRSRLPNREQERAQTILRTLFDERQEHATNNLCIAIWRAYWQTFRHCTRHAAMEEHLVECHETPRIQKKHKDATVDIAVQQLHHLIIEKVFRGQVGCASRASDFYQGLLGPVLGSVVRKRGDSEGEAQESAIRDAAYIAMQWVQVMYRNLAEHDLALEDFNAIPKSKLAKAPKAGKQIEPTFHQRGSWASVIVNISFFLRFHLWAVTYAMGEQTIIGSDDSNSLLLLALIDSAMVAFFYFCETHLLWGSRPHYLNMILKLIQGIVHLLLFLGIFYMRVYAKQSTGMVFVNSTTLRTKLEFELFYVIGSIFVAWTKELFRQFRVSGYSEHAIEGARRSVKTFHQTIRVVLARVLLYVFTSGWIFASILIFTQAGNRETVRAEDALTFYEPLIAAVFGALAIQMLIAEPLISISPNTLKPHLNRCYGLPAAIWILVIAVYAVAMIEWAVPSVLFLTNERVCYGIDGAQGFSCFLAIASVWGAMVLVGMAAFHLIDRGWAIAGSTMIGKYRGVGLVQGTNNMAQLGWGFMARPLRNILEVGSKTSKQVISPKQVWDTMLHHDMVTYHISEEERDRGRLFATEEVNDHEKRKKIKQEGEHDPFGNVLETETKEDNGPNWKLLQFASGSIRRRLAFLSQSLKLMPPPIHDPTNPDTIPSAAVVIPLYNEAILCSEKALLARRIKGQACDLELMISAHTREFALLARKLRPFDCEELEQHLEKAKDKDDRISWALFRTFQRRVIHEKETIADGGLVADVVIWASLRQQTAGRALYGMDNLRRGMELVVGQEEATEKFQVVLAAQEYRNLAKHREDLTYLQKRLTFEIVYDLPVKTNPSEHDEPEQLASLVTQTVQRLEGTDAPVIVCLMPKVVEAVGDVDDKKSKKAKEEKKAADEELRAMDESAALKAAPMAPPPVAMAYFACHRTYDPLSDTFTTRCVQRPGPLLGVPDDAPKHRRLQAKACNQDNAFNFVRAEAVLTMDMNQDASIQEGLKLPTLLSHYFHDPQDAIVGTAEWCNSRNDTLVGELLGAAEFTFTTQTQRYLAGALRMRLHYGHGDFFCVGYARMAGGCSKSSPGVHLSEDVFAGYEAVARNESVKHLEWFQPEKSRDVGFNATQKFHAKINQGNAMQFRSREVYFLFAQMPIVARLSLLSSAFSFYMLNVQFTFATFLYGFANVLFAVSNVRFHTLGLLQGKIASAWLLQLGWLLALPLFCENVMQFGIYTGFIMFWKTIIPSLFYFAATLMTNSYHFQTSVATTAAAYLPTGRGYELDAGMGLKSSIQAFGMSHFWPAARYVFIMIWFGAVSPEDGTSIILRILPILIIVISSFLAWLWFSAVPSASTIISQLKDAVRWVIGHSELTDVDIEQSDVKTVTASVGQLDRANSFSGWRTRLAMQRFMFEEENLPGGIIIVQHFLEDLLTELFFISTLVSSVDPRNLPAAVMMALVAVTVLLSRYVAYKMKIIHLVSPFDLLLITVVIITVALYFNYYKVNVGGVLICIGTIAYLAIRAVPMGLAWIFRVWYMLFGTCCCCFGCCCLSKCGCADSRSDVYRWKWRLRSAKMIAFSETGVASIVLGILFFGALISSVASTMFTSLMYNAGFTRKVQMQRAQDEVYELEEPKRIVIYGGNGGDSRPGLMPRGHSQQNLAQTPGQSPRAGRRFSKYVSPTNAGGAPISPRAAGRMRSRAGSMNRPQPKPPKAVSPEPPSRHSHAPEDDNGSGAPFSPGVPAARAAPQSPGMPMASANLEHGSRPPALNTPPSTIPSRRADNDRTLH